MKHIIVIAGNQVQFEDYVNEVKFLKVSQMHLGNKVIVEGVTFLHVKDSYQIRGYHFSYESELVEVGSYYTIPDVVRNDIKKQFILRREKK